MRKRRAEARRAAIAEHLGANPFAALLARGLPAAFAPAFGVHPSTIWRDLQYVLYGGSTCNFWGEGEFLFSVTRAYPGGPVLSVADAEDNEIRGPRRRAILRHVRRYASSRR